MTLIDHALAVIKNHAAIRTSALSFALKFEGTDDELDIALQPAVDDGRLITCAITLGGDVHTTEYRLSVMGGGKTISHPNYRMKSATPPAPRHESIAAQVPAKATSGSDAAPDVSPGVPAARLEPAGRRAIATPARAVATTRETSVKPFRERVSAVFQKHGPMTTQQLREHGITDANASTLVGQLANRGVLAKLGGGKRSTIYGLPDQNAPEAPEKTDPAPRAIHRRTRKHAKKRVGGGSVAVRRKRAVKAAKKAWKTRRAANGAKAFRPALAADGAILMLGAKGGDFEIPRAQARDLVDLNRRLTTAELADLVNFMTRLDNAEVGA